MTSAVPQQPLLALEGGAPVRATAFAPWPFYEQDEIDAVSQVLSSGLVNYWTGPQCTQFEQAYAAFCGRRHAIALANGSVALELALHAFGIGPGDEVVTTSRTFIASASCAVLRGATPVMADVDPVSQNITADGIRAVLTPRTRAVIVVHLAGWPCDMDPILELASAHGLRVIEDCAQAHGATYQGRPVGSFGAAAAFSFCQDKIISTGGEGGMLLLDDTAAWEKAWAYKDHGKSYDAVFRREHPPGFRWAHESFGTNWRMTEMQAAIGRMQLAKLPGWVARRQHLAGILSDGFAALPGVRVTRPGPGIGHAYYKYYAFLEPERLRPDWDHNCIIAAINAEGIPCIAGSCGEIYMEKVFVDAGLAPAARLPIAQRLGATSLSFLVHPTLTDADMLDTCAAVAKVMHAAVRP
ncbi:MAG: DegT/DnrJ/EryC1/StrS aminotransferase family protein [Betaproteobacteria bacterium]|nr:DegT/DnrJ/EryC1/StrS aminotransferase family protein [Betaproteobacteria bacterium]